MAQDHAVLTGPIRGTVTLDDGTEVDVRPEIIFVDSQEQAFEVSQKIGELYAAKGHPSHDIGDEFIFDTEQSRKNFGLTKENE